MKFVIQISENPINPGSNLTISIQSDEDLSSIKMEIIDSNGNTRMISRRHGNTSEFITKFPETRLAGDWEIKITGTSIDGERESDSEVLMVELENRQDDDRSTEMKEELEPDSELEEDHEMLEDKFSDTSSDIAHTEEKTTEDEIFKSNEAEKDIGLVDQMEKEEITDSAILEDPLTAINGVGNATESKLIEIGIEDINALAGATVDQLKEAGIDNQQARKIIENAMDFLND